MDNSNLTTILTILLASSVIILFVLIIIFIALSLRKRRIEKEENMKLVGTDQEKKASSNVIQTRAYTATNIKNFMDFDDIKDNLIVQEKGKRYVMVLQCQGVNYDLMSNIEKVSVEQGFIQFLNSLTRPIQLHIQARKVNLEKSLQNYNARLKNIESRYRNLEMQYQQAMRNPNMDKEQFDRIRYEYVRQKNLYEYTKDIIDNTEKMSMNKNILTKNYYIALSYTPDNSEGLYEKDELIDMAFSELYTNAQSLLRVLSVTGVTGKVLNSVELADLLYVAYNRDASEVFGVDKAIQANYDALYTTAPDVIDKKIAALDQVIKERALDMANDAIAEATLNNRRKQELERKERNIQELVKEMAKSMIHENEDYISKEISKEAVEVIDKAEEPEEKKTTRRTRARKGAEE